ncbi:unnamed protein product [Mytilus edulis]|uniref:Uncharacterized protein n=1 Tax=Mytilus edulis TaxID=6550 RepID=A0A8S3RUI9_MYTED|nr:unnamed protein product [Mytilus edulis]
MKKMPKLQVMTPEIRQAITDKKNAYYDWKQNNRPNDPNNQWLQKKKVTTCNLRKECRLTLAKQQLERKSELINAKNTFEEQDIELERQLYTLNGRIREINKRIGSHSPEFSSDISNTSKYHCGKDRKLKTTRNYEFGLYQDGIHPGELLAKNWLKKISEQAKRDCWETVHKPPLK